MTKISYLVIGAILLLPSLAACRGQPWTVSRSS
jgi:hypothetical protein